ncbi:type II toxin-antitoxin system RelE/ParE family toxin [Kozakia baliensis]|uniref:type II toxin-antitoxin system RelE/ParE family toxin n=1 Tax=Kozakia baliensis TaxID=153496 RepID=UPI00087ACD08|nr:type II toxin-antitoxin system RelE/ParE family toxin [Kozakia baliensis]AOX21654.1 addiction module antitoxin RelB [Kozakia baliensis]
MMQVQQTRQFREWLATLRDQRAAAKIRARLILMEAGAFGDVEPCGEGISETRLHYGPGYRIYFVQRGNVLVIVLGGGTKRTQPKDIRRAKELARDVEKFL